MKIELSTDELKTLETAVDRAVRALENELVHTEAPALQHEIARDFRRLVALRDRMFGPDRDVSGDDARRPLP